MTLQREGLPLHASPVICCGSSDKRSLSSFRFPSSAQNATSTELCSTSASHVRVDLHASVRTAFTATLCKQGLGLALPTRLIQRTSHKKSQMRLVGETWSGSNCSTVSGDADISTDSASDEAARCFDEDPRIITPDKDLVILLK